SSPPNSPSRCGRGRGRRTPTFAGTPMSGFRIDSPGYNRELVARWIRVANGGITMSSAARWSLAAIVALACAAMMDGVGFAQEAMGSGKLPPGSWSQSCRKGYTDKGWLYAQCQRRDGNWRDASIDMRSCPNGRFGNDNGRLVCESGGGRLPPGSWSQTCRNGYVQGGWVYAECQRKNGNWRNANAALGSRPGGGLAQGKRSVVCERGGGKLPSGSWSQSCRNGYVNGNWMTAQCRQRDGNWTYANLDLRSCQGGPVGNNNGRLFCESGGGGGGKLPPGSWNQTCS